MNKLILTTLVAFAASAHAGNDSNTASVDRGYAIYRHTVLGDTTAQRSGASNPSSDADSRVPGAYARYLMYLGNSKTDAIDKAVRVGEVPGAADSDASRRSARFTSYEAYQYTVLGRSQAQILSRRATNASMAADSGSPSKAVR
jgi:hypothetical protein